MKNLFLPSYIYKKGLIFVFLFGLFLFLYVLMQLLQHVENIYLFLLIGFIVAFFIQSGESIYDPLPVRLN